MTTPNLLGVTINAGDTVSIARLLSGTFPTVNLDGQQSLVHSLVLTFDAPLLAAPVVTIAPHPGVTVTHAPGPSQLAVLAIIEPVPGGQLKLWRVRFSGPGAEPTSGVIANGVYDLTVNGVMVKTFWALSGGVESPSVTVKVPAASYTEFQSAFGAAIEEAEYIAKYDANLDGGITTVENSAFPVNASWTW